MSPSLLPHRAPDTGAHPSPPTFPSIEPTEAGDYKLCFDNSFSTISEKLVFFELLFDSPQDEEDAESWAEAVEPEDMLDVKIEDIKVGGHKNGPIEGEHGSWLGWVRS